MISKLKFFKITNYWLQLKLQDYVIRLKTRSLQKIIYTIFVNNYILFKFMVKKSYLNTSIINYQVYRSNDMYFISEIKWILICRHFH